MHVSTLGDALRQPAHHASLADACYANQARIVAFTFGQYVERLLDHVVTSHHWIELTARRRQSEVLAQLTQQRKTLRIQLKALVTRRLRGHGRGHGHRRRSWLAQAHERDRLGRSELFGGRKQRHLHGPQASLLQRWRGLGLRSLRDRRYADGHRRGRTPPANEAQANLHGLRAQTAGIDAKRFERAACHGARLTEQCQEQVRRRWYVRAHARADLLGARQGRRDRLG